MSVAVYGESNCRTRARRARTAASPCGCRRHRTVAHRGDETFKTCEACTRDLVRELTAKLEPKKRKAKR